MDFRSELKNDLDFSIPQILITSCRAIIENVTSIALLSDNAVTVSCDKHYVTVKGEGFVIKEISEGRLVIEGKVRGMEFL